jgi:hypothetical protein
VNEHRSVIDDYFDGELSPAEAARLEAWLSDSAEHRRLFTEQALDHLLLHDVLVATAPQVDVPVAAGASAHRFRTRLWQLATRPTPLSISVAAIVIGLFITAMAFIAAPIYSRIVRTSPDYDDAPTFVAELSGTHNVQWAEGQIGTREGSHLVVGHRLDLESGLAEITFRNGTRVVLEGPAVLTLDSSAQATLQSGRLTARVDAPARGFAVVTTAATFVDLGTEFGVDVVDANAAELHVFEGVVEARVAGESGTHRITQGGGLQVDGAMGTTRRLVSRSHRFVRNLPRWIPIHVENASFEEPRLVASESWRTGVPGWTNSLPAHHGVSSFGREFAQPVPDGTQMAFLNEGEITQVLAETLQPDTAYRLTVWIGNRPGPNSPNYSVELWAGETELAGSENQNIPIKGRLAPVTLNYACDDPQSPAIGAPLKIVLRSHGSLATATQNHFDDVRLWRVSTAANSGEVKP